MKLMDPIIGTILVALITGIFSIVTLRIQKNQDKLIRKIDEQTIFIEQEKSVRQKLVQAEKRRDGIIEQMTILSMKINIHLINTLAEVDGRIVDDLKKTSNELEASYKEASDAIKDISREYEVLINLSNHAQSELERMNANRKGNKR